MEHTTITMISSNDENQVNQEIITILHEILTATTEKDAEVITYEDDNTQDPDTFKKPTYKLITAICRGGGIGVNGDLPWGRIKEDMAFFSRMTRDVSAPGKRTAVVMGRKTWESIPSQFKPLKERDNLILTTATDSTQINQIHQPNQLNQTILDVPIYAFQTVAQLKKWCEETGYETVWVIGGESLYNDFLNDSACVISSVYITYIDAPFCCDRYFPRAFPYNNNMTLCYTHTNAQDELWNWNTTQFPGILSWNWNWFIQQSCGHHISSIGTPLYFLHYKRFIVV